MPKAPQQPEQNPDDGLTQRERFEQAARKLECDDDLEHFSQVVRKIAKASPTPQGKAHKAKPPKKE